MKFLILSLSVASFCQISSAQQVNLKAASKESSPIFTSLDPAKLKVIANHDFWDSISLLYDGKEIFKQEGHMLWKTQALQFSEIGRNIVAARLLKTNFLIDISSGESKVDLPDDEKLSGMVLASDKVLCEGDSVNSQSYVFYDGLPVASSQFSDHCHDAVNLAKAVNGFVKTSGIYSELKPLPPGPNVNESAIVLKTMILEQQ